ncbi:hypothetical protein [Tateyamaria sp. ANG-S1]|uniref:hypothetical protein n=1 Tax=Tateyamaria sp. ANG-S1 TaxID=1577905 RepID=UPI00057DEF94|nr:hypothetical protein [Tateyamaria sp. ANG-S1]KIC50896.1 hypothetical protein RA29_03065 [Tateyamaria sp. ANG-S1]
MDHYDADYEARASELHVSDAEIVPANQTVGRLKTRARSNNVVAFPTRIDGTLNSGTQHPETADGASTLIESGDLWARDVFLICDDESTARPTMNALADRMNSLTQLNDVASAFQLAGCCDGADIMLALDLDAIPNVANTFIQLSELRQTSRGLAVLTMSQSFSRTCVMHRENPDFSDASVRLPASEYEMSVALHFAVTNAFFRAS